MSTSGVAWIRIICGALAVSFFLLSLINLEFGTTLADQNRATRWMIRGMIFCGFALLLSNPPVGGGL